MLVDINDKDSFDETESNKILIKNFRDILEENEILRIQINSREKEIEELSKELDDIHSSISYKIGRAIAETSIGRALKSFLKKHLFK